MEICDIQEIWGRIKALHPNTPEEKRPRLTKLLAEAWRNELSEYSLDQVMDAVERQAGKSRFWPDLAEIKAELPKRTAEGATKPQPSRGVDAKAKEAQDRLFARMRSERDRLIPLRQAAGIPATMEEARETGMTATEWWDRCERVGLNYPDNVFCEEGAL